MKASAMRVVYFVSLFPCWSETFIVREIRALIDLGADVRIVSLKAASEAMVQSDAESLLNRVIYPPHMPRALWLAGTEILLHPLRSVAELAQIVRGFRRQPQAMVKTLVTWWRTLAMLRELRRLQPTHLHAHWATYPSTAAMFSAGRLNVPFSFTSHAHDIFLDNHLLAPKLAQARFSVTISQYNRRFLAGRVALVLLDRMRVIHCGVSPQDYAFKPHDRRPGLILAVGRLDPIKGFEHLVEACSLLARRGVDFQCGIVGEGPLHAVITQQIASLGLQHKVQLLGARKQEDVRTLLNTAAVFVLPSVITPQGDRDGIPVALMEAMACGTPVVSTRVSGIPELVTDRLCGLLAAPGDAAELACCIELQLGNTAEVRERVVQARYKVETEFAIAVEAAKLHAAITDGLLPHSSAAQIKHA
jgi:glycosyltransferase involved in cell wall biosynthesis